MADALPGLELVDLDGRPISLAQWHGQRLLINFWATWCPPCRAEMPALEALYQANKDDGFVVVAVNSGEGAEAVRQFVEEYGLTFPVLLDPQGAAQDRLGIRYLPTSIFVDSRGVMRSRWQGALSPDQMVEGVKKLE